MKESKDLIVEVNGTEEYEAGGTDSKGKMAN